MMPAIPANQARARLYPLIDQVAKEGPVQVVGRRGSAVLVSAEEWSAMVSTLEILSDKSLMKRIYDSAKVPRSAMKALDQIRAEIARDEKA